MFDENGKVLISKFKTLTDFIEEIAETGDENAALILEELHSFGRLLVDYVLECSNEISKLNAQKVESEEDIKKLKEKLEALEKAVPKKDYVYYSGLAQNKYKKYWSVMEKSSKTFITTAMYMFNLLRVHNADFSPVILEYTKSLEEEIKQKIYLGFLKEESKKPILPNNGKWTDAVEKYKERQFFFIPLSMMFYNLNSPKNVNGVSYWANLHQMLKRDGWDMPALTDPKFISDGVRLAEDYRNWAAHIYDFTDQDAIYCSMETKKLICHFLSAYPQK